MGKGTGIQGLEQDQSLEIEIKMVEDWDTAEQEAYPEIEMEGSLKERVNLDLGREMVKDTVIQEQEVNQNLET